MSKFKEFLDNFKKSGCASTESNDKGRKRYKDGKALLVGINYYGTSSELNGCINDVNNVYRYLTTVEKYDPKDIHILTDERHTPKNERPTRANILSEIKWLVEDPYKRLAKEVRPQTSLFMHYSGHGSWTWERGHNKDEDDRRDETICPVDYDKAGMIKDDDLRKLLVDPVKDNKHMKLTALFDCCHSGTIIDLRYHIKTSVVPNNPNTRRLVIDENKHYPKGCSNITLFSGSMDKQYSADAYINRQAQGMMTFAFLEIIKVFRKDKRKLTYKKFLTALQVFAAKNGYDQIPQLCMNHYPDLKAVYEI